MRLIFIRKFFIAQASALLLIAANAYSACLLPDFGVPLEEQLVHLSSCQNHPVYLAQIGHLLNGLGRYAESLEHLERALMLDSESAEIQLDYAIALAGNGDWLSATELLDALSTQTSLPPALRHAVMQAKNRIVPATTMPIAANSAYSSAAPVASVASALRLSAQIRVGNDSNLLGSPRLDQLEISLPNEIITLPLDGSMQPRTGVYTRTDARMEWSLGLDSIEQGTWELSANLSQRRSGDVPEADSHQEDFNLEYNPYPHPHPYPHLTTWQPYAVITRSNFEAVRGTRFTNWGTGGGVQIPLFGCSTRVGGEWQDRQVMSNPLLSGVYTGLSTLWRCHKHWQWALKMGEDRPQHSERPGGRQHTASVRSLFFNGTWLWDSEFSHTHDSIGYSPLLNYDAVRSTHRFSTRLEYQMPLEQQWVAAWGLEWSGQDSNLALFQMRSWGSYASIRWIW